MAKEVIEAEKILSEYGRRMYEAHITYFDVGNNSIPREDYVPARKRSRRRSLRLSLILCAVLLLVLSLTITVCSALGLHLFNFKFDLKDGFIVITRTDNESGAHFYKPTYIADNYSFSETVELDDSERSYIYVDKDSNLDYVISESKDSDSTIYIDDEDYEKHKEYYNSYELVVFNDRTTSLLVVRLEIDNTYISISGHLTIDQIHSIIDSFEIDDQ